MPKSISDSMDRLLDRFDEAWNDPTPPRIEDYLAKADPDKRLALLIELVRIDLERRLMAGEEVRLEAAYFPRFPELAAETPAIVTLVKHEYAVRRRNEPELMPKEYLERFPQWQTELVAQWQTIDEIPDGEPRPKIAEGGLDLRGYELMETLGKGGMGEVYRSIDPALGRGLAIKVMKSEYRGHVEAERRFLREARITGSLQHPNIVPVYNLGRLADGRVHYTMRMVRGKTFADILKEEAGQAERLPYLLSIFEKICQAVAYAHSKRVIHRDLKPQNVMVGRFGEVQVMDWGLAKLLTAEPIGTHIIVDSTDTPVCLSTRGSVVGTVAYMPREQALGEMVDERADVFALGSILCEMLTGQPAYSGADFNEVYLRAKCGDVAEALQRMQQCGADAALTALCRECLSPHREDRPLDSAAVAKRMAEYQVEVQERLRRAELANIKAQLRAREKRKWRRLTLALSATVLLALLAGTLISTLFAIDAHKQADAARKHADNAEREKRRADENARQAEAERLFATQVRDEAKLTLHKTEIAVEAERAAMALHKSVIAAEAKRAANKLAQNRLDQIEPLLLQGYEGMKAREAKIPPRSKMRLTEALERLVQLYEATEQKDKAADWRKKLQETKAAQKKPKS